MKVKNIESKVALRWVEDLVVFLELRGILELMKQHERGSQADSGRAKILIRNSFLVQ